jgi:hypothetical protein
MEVSLRKRWRGRGRPRLRWLEDAEKDVLEMEVKLWRQKAVGREEWGGQGSQRAVQPRTVGEYLKILF